MEAGHYIGHAVEARVWEGKSGSVMIFFRLLADEDRGEITGSQCIVQKDGTISQITLNSLKQAWPLWPTTDPFWFEDLVNLETAKISFVVGQETYEGKTRPVVKYINSLDRAGGLPKAMDRNSFMQRHGAKLRALSGGTAIKPPAPAAAPKPPSPITPPKPPPAAPVAPPTPQYPPSDMNEAWAFLCAKRTGLTEEQITKQWEETIIALAPGKTNATMSPDDWGRVQHEFDANTVPY